ncbi:MAG TPA: spore coat U domain-containing protein [Thermoanaerobaculia bacterium]|jgi:spore coat protein U-like protein|nr:spore coat U domain-containing protein [Thermoanaerobaculia bacterium]
MKRTVLSLIVLAVLVFSVPVFAASATANLNVSASVSAVCTITTSPVAFGAYDPVSANASTDLTAQGAVNVACTKGTAATIDLGTGGSFSGGTRRMASGTDFLNYSLFQDAALTQVWGSGIAGGATANYNAASKSVTAVTVYGMVPQAQDVTVGSYADVVLATINY